MEIKYEDIKINRKDFFVSIAFILSSLKDKFFEAKAIYRTEETKNMENIIFKKNTTIYRLYEINCDEQSFFVSEEQEFYKEEQYGLFNKKEENLDEFIKYNEALAILGYLYSQYNIDIEYFFQEIIKYANQNNGNVSFNNLIAMICDYVEKIKSNDSTNILMRLARNLEKKDIN